MAGRKACSVRSSGIVEDRSPLESEAADHGDEADPLERDPKLIVLANRIAAAGLKGSWCVFKDPATGKVEGPCFLDIEIPSGRSVRHVPIHAEDAEVLAPFKFERWTALRGYQAILDTDKRAIIAEVQVNAFQPFHRLPGVMEWSPGETELESTLLANTVRAIHKSLGEWEPSAYLTIPAPNSDLSLELRSVCPPEIAVLNRRLSLSGYGLIISGVTTTRHDEALELLLDLSTSFFIDLDIGYGFKANLKKAHDPELVARVGYDSDPPSTAVPRFPGMLHNRDAASLYLYARQLIDIPLLEYLVYYQVIEFYLPTYTRSATIIRLRNMLKDPSFDYNNDLALGRLLDTISPTSRKAMGEREQVATTIAHCVGDGAIAAFWTTGQQQLRPLPTITAFAVCGSSVRATGIPH
jgi:hypothetical protein